MIATDPHLEQRFISPLLAALSALGGSGKRAVVALNGPVGSGKTTLCRQLQQRAAAQGLLLAVASIDDFYLPWEQRIKALAGNQFGVSRVLPGSHDAGLAQACVDGWQRGGKLRLPRFDKSLRGGQGDRAGEILVEADVLLLEGWLLGCRPLVSQPAGSPAMAEGGSRWDRALVAYQPLWQLFEQLWLLRPERWSMARRWRFQAEARQRRRGEDWLPAMELERLVRSSLESLPPDRYQDPLIEIATCTATLDGRRRWLAGSGAS